MKILSIETSCDETSLAIIETDGGNLIVHAHNTLSQIDVHREYGGVFPSLAKREHAKNLVPLFTKTIQDIEINNKQNTNLGQIPDNQKTKVQTILDREPELLKNFLEEVVLIKNPEIDAIAVTHGPGLEPALWTGINFAKALNIIWNVPIIPVNHMEGHIASVLIKEYENPKPETSSNSKQVIKLREICFPAIALLVSGGHTELVLIKGWGEYELIGQTLDDAVGEAFDKVARQLSLPYPGGPEISRLSMEARENDIKPPFSLSRPMLKSKDLNFSFSGIKTAVRYQIEKMGQLSEKDKKGIAREFEEAVVETLIKKSEKACQLHKAKEFLVAGGVAANQFLVENIESSLEFPKIHKAPKSLCGDNSLMIALAGYKRSLYSPDKLVLSNPDAISAIGNLSIENVEEITKQTT